MKHAIAIAGALTKAHGAGIIHRDLKPGNIMVTPEGMVKVLDFGLAKMIEAPLTPGDETRAPRPQTQAGMVMGTPAFMSPEQAEGKAVDARSDIFSFGSVLYETITGKCAFQGDSMVATMAAVLQKEPEPLPEGVSRELEIIVTRCLRKDPERRFQSMSDVRVALVGAQEGGQEERIEGGTAATRTLPGHSAPGYGVDGAAPPIPEPSSGRKPPYLIIPAIRPLRCLDMRWWPSLRWRRWPG